MLDENNDQLSSELSGDQTSKKNEVSSSKTEENDGIADDNQKEDAKVKNTDPEEEKTDLKELVEDSPAEDKVKKENVSEVAERANELPEKEHTEDKVQEASIESVEEEVISENTEPSVEAEKGHTEEKVQEASAESVEEEVISEKTEPSVEAEKELKKVKKIPEFDASGLSLEANVEMIKKLLDEFEVQEVKNQIEILKSEFQKKFKSFLKEQKEAFVKAGGEEAEFYYSEPLKHKFDEVVSQYKIKRQQFYKDIERIQKENLELRLSLIDELKNLIDNAEASTMYKNFKNLQDKWRDVGQIPHAKYNDVWRTYHHHVERFYDLLHLNNDFRDLDFKHNLEEKSKLIEKAETLATKEDVNHAFKELQILHKMWKEDIGPVSRELREEVWHRFSEATKKIHKKRHEFQEKLDEKFKANVDLKLAVVEKIKGIDTLKNQTHKDWQNSIKKLEGLRDEFFAIGKVPKSRNEEVWQLFREATRSFNVEKNKFYKEIKKAQSENLTKKLALVEQAESLKDSDDWVAATEVFKRIQSEWKKIGHVPRRDSDKIWKRFKDACNHYFDRLHNKQNDLNKDQSAVIEKKKEFMDALKKEIEKEKDLTLEFVQKGMEEWRAL